MNMTVLGTAFLGFSIGAHASGLIPAWQRSVGALGALLLLITGLANTAVADGSSIALAGFGGFILWLCWLVITGVRLLGDAGRGLRQARRCRSPRPHRPRQRNRALIPFPSPFRTTKRIVDAGATLISRGQT